MAERGAQLNSEVSFFTDDSCLLSAYDLVAVNSSLQYIPDWKALITKIAHSNSSYFLLHRIPVVKRDLTYVAIQQQYGLKMFYNVFQEQELLSQVNLSFDLVREFVIADFHSVSGKSDIAELKSWLFKNKKNN